MSYSFDPVPFFPEGYFPAFYPRLFKRDSELQAIYPNAGVVADWDSVIKAREGFDPIIRKTLCNVLRRQYTITGCINEKALVNIEKLADDNAFTVTTGQQIHIFLGPLYLIYKALSTIHMAQELSNRYPGKQFVPIFWMATEDHDKEEIDHFELFGKTYKWDTPQQGPVGRFDTEGLAAMAKEIKGLSRGDEDFSRAIEVFEHAYSSYNNLADATRFLLDHFFGREGLVVLDADVPELKFFLKNAIRKDLFDNEVGPAIASASKKLKDLQIEPVIPARESNFFLLEEGHRRRLDRVEGGFALQNSDVIISREEIENKIEETPEIFSPNVALRPIYQETILPNLAYIGGPSELQYWLQLADIFAICGIKNPVLIPRHSFVILDGKFTSWQKNSGFERDEMWGSEDSLKELIKQRLSESNALDGDTRELKNLLDKIYEKLYRQHNTELKNIKKSGDDFLQALKKAEQLYADNLFSIPENRARLDKTLKFKRAFFDVDKPQERTTAFLQFHLTNTHFLDEIIELPSPELTCLYIATYKGA